ncbi:hypothetical protein LTR57_000713 [Friedmanniomyces endolithicus]|uniref:Uncharacterized protein n=1 Tax=Friedmanniomyces endolithicus TaxID=329885 RepID=A0AAN6FF64_9PEZI|nr:hypothetical protein LTR82_011645 [Friedmanniomyces endolithicus]KAK0931298.1 hypothetical protein LTR57_000713 [Friedmanniomyces endolithicus]
MATTSTRGKHDDYWKIRIRPGYDTAKVMRDKLKDRNYHVSGNMRKDLLSECLRRSYLGILSHHKLTIPELRERIKARKIDTTGFFPKLTTSSRQELLSALEQADLNPKFEHFLQLPPELRNKIYADYYAEFKGRSTHQASHLSRTPFEIRLRRTRIGPKFRMKRFLISEKNALFLHNTEPKYVATVRRLLFTFVKDPRPLADGPACRLQLGKGGDYRLQLPGPVVSRDPSGDRLANKARSQAGTAVRELVARIVARPEKDKLRREDFFELCKAVALEFKFG